MLDCTICENEARIGGGVYSQGDASNIGGLVNNCMIRGNNAADRGGGMFFSLGIEGGGLALNCTIVSNAVVVYGGGIRFDNGGRARNCLIAANQAGTGGGLYNNSTGTAGNVESCTIVRNSASSNAGGAHLAGGSLTNSIVWHNTSTGKTPPQSADLSFTAAAATVGYSCSPNLVEGVAGNIVGTPLFKDAGTGAGVGATLGDYRLSLRSPCVDSGLNLPWMIGASDFEGSVRVYPANGRVDMGAHEEIYPLGTLLYVR